MPDYCLRCDSLGCSACDPNTPIDCLTCEDLGWVVYPHTDIRMPCPVCDLGFEEPAQSDDVDWHRGRAEDRMIRHILREN